jgi:hypothetical protein
MYVCTVVEPALFKWPDNRNKHWSPDDIRQLKQLARENTPTRVAGLKLAPTPQAVQNKASELGVSLKPANQRPYGTKK